MTHQPKLVDAMPEQTLVEHARKLRSDLNDELPNGVGNTIDALAERIERLEALLRRIEPHIDAIVCYASTMGEHEPNRIAFDIRAALSASNEGEE